MEVLRRQTKFRDPNTESVVKLKNMETKLSEVRASMVTLQKEAISAMLSVEEHQQKITMQKLLMMVILYIYFLNKASIFYFFMLLYKN